MKIDKIKNNENIIEALYKIMNDYIEGYGEDRHPLPEFYAIEDAIKDVERMNKIRILLAMDNKQHNRTIKLSELKEVIEL